MAKIVYADRVQEFSVTAPALGNLDLDGGSQPGFRGFVAGIGTTNKCYYMISGGIHWEVGVGTVTDAATDTLSRDTVIDSSAGATIKVNWPVDGTGLPITAHCVNPALVMSNFAASDRPAATFEPDAGSGTDSLAIGASAVAGNATTRALALLRANVSEGTDVVGLGNSTIYADTSLVVALTGTNTLGASAKPLVDCLVFASNVSIEGDTTNSSFIGDTIDNDDIPGAGAGTEPATFVQVRGQDATAYMHGARFRASGQRAAIGDRQRIEVLLSAATTNDDVTTLQQFGGEFATWGMDLKDNRVYAVYVQAGVFEYDAALDYAMWDGTALVYVNGSGVITITGSTITKRHATAGATWSIAFGDTGRELELNATGEAGHNLNWSAQVELLELG